MSVIDVHARIQQIQVQLAQLHQVGRPVAATSTAFAEQLAATTATTPTESAGGTVTGDAVVAEAKKYLGVPYVWGGTDPASGLDCSGLVQLVHKNLGIDLPRVSWQQATAGQPVAGGLANATPGDILAFGSPVDHVGIYLGNNQMIEAPRPGKNVQISEVWATPTAVRRVVADAPVTGVAVTGTVSPSTPYAVLFNTAGATHGVSPALLAAVARQESGFDPSAVSHAGAQGLMQLMPATARGLGVTNPFDPTQAVDGAARLLSDLLDRFGSTELALAAYNAGPGAVLRHDGIPPYRETQNYVSSVMGMLGGTR
ncbi:transglycosylase SLT domain-containing protein [Nocardioides sp. AE5]|uniref:transglycosylase SLT domain-containing protein n=1 Tax=Nocardioides sp. AE5 TaxID=2962573 RepID=UPI002881B101|nr:transglycosylase SLT domain-containing protein [Nocardioides sp. AE5]MDT0200798.1 transglycosylase SLT domain-containing protein [Nocardioides sp. AE5]